MKLKALFMVIIIFLSLTGTRNQSCTDPSAPCSAPANAQSYRSQKGSIFYFQVMGANSGALYGTDIYTDDSSIACASVHAGLLAVGQIGVIQLTIVEGKSVYTGSTRNGVKSSDSSIWGGSYTLVLVPCLTGCTTCDSSITCLTCSAGYGLTNKVCQTCANGKFTNSASICETCPTGCATCDSSTTCQTCTPGNGLTSNMCQTCDSGKFTNSASICETCPTGCATCDSSTTCQTCSAGYGLTNNMCQTCGNGKFTNSASICETCPTGCATCDSSSACQSCKPNYRLDNSQCAVCPSGTFLSVNTCIGKYIQSNFY